MTDQEDREKVIKGLGKLHENCGCVAVHDCDCKTCPYERVNGCCDQIVVDALVLLKAQEPRVMTLEEFNAHWQIPPQERKPIWEEWKVDNGKGKWKLYGRATGGYGDMWRCWTSRPTDEQREGTSWRQ